MGRRRDTLPAHLPAPRMHLNKIAAAVAGCSILGALVVYQQTRAPVAGLRGSVMSSLSSSPASCPSGTFSCGSTNLCCRSGAETCDVTFGRCLPLPFSSSSASPCPTGTTQCGSNQGVCCDDLYETCEPLTQQCYPAWTSSSSAPSCPDKEISAPDVYGSSPVYANSKRGKAQADARKFAAAACSSAMILPDACDAGCIDGGLGYVFDEHSMKCPIVSGPPLRVQCTVTGSCTVIRRCSAP